LPFNSFVSGDYYYTLSGDDTESNTGSLHILLYAPPRRIFPAGKTPDIFDFQPGIRDTERL
jgi:hypothetical protein